MTVKCGNCKKGINLSKYHKVGDYRYIKLNGEYLYGKIIDVQLVNNKVCFKFEQNKNVIYYVKEKDLYFLPPTHN